MQRRHRLSRSRDFDAVYRQGKSVSTRSLVLYWFERHDDHDADARVGIAVPRKVGGAVVRNRLKRQLREAWRTQGERAAHGRDYIIVARPGLADAADANGIEWLSERLGETLEQATP